MKGIRSITQKSPFSTPAGPTNYLKNTLIFTLFGGTMATGIWLQRNTDDIKVTPKARDRPLPPVSLLKEEQIRHMLHQNETQMESASQKLAIDFNSVASNFPIEDYSSQHVTRDGVIIGY